MATNSSVQWRSGNSICRCCLSEGCYKDISTEYFWMGKREVYSEMLAETFDLCISFSKNGGPNSNSRLICEACISRLRDAAEFKRQVKDCEKTFVQLLEPGSSQDTSTVGKEIKKELKLENLFSDDDDDDFLDDTNDFGDDDLDDEPLMKLASKTPKKEPPVQLKSVLSKGQIGLKRKAPAPVVQSKSTPPKKVKIEVKKVSATTSSAKNPEKPKKGFKPEDIQIKKEVDYEIEIPTNTDVVKERNLENERRETFRKNISLILESCTAYPFKYRRGTYLCFFCKNTFLEPDKLREHTTSQHTDMKKLPKPRKYEPLKIDFLLADCKICGVAVTDYNGLKSHLTKEHGKIINSTYGENVLPYKLMRDEHVCQVCGKRYEMFLSLHKHMNDHYEHFICETCGKGFATAHRMMSHSRTHARGNFPCKQCTEFFPSYASLYSHVAKIHKSNKRYKCPICEEKFSCYKHRLKHLKEIHGEKPVEFPCPSCPKVFDLCSRRTAHIRFQHLQERNHVCLVCGMKFFTKFELQEHSVKHGGERIFQCDVCKKSYARLKTLREHMRIHNNDRRFVCPVCGQSFIQNCSLKQHLRVQHPAHLQ